MTDNKKELGEMPPQIPQRPDIQPRAPYGGGLAAICAIAAQFGISANPQNLAHQLALDQAGLSSNDLVRAARLLGLKAKIVKRPTLDRLQSIPIPAIVSLADGGWAIFGREVAPGKFNFIDPISMRVAQLDSNDIFQRIGADIVLVTKARTASDERARFGFSWFANVFWRYRRAITHVLVASFFIQVFALSSPLIFQMVVDKVLVYKSYSTLVVLIIAMVVLAIFDSTMKYLRGYALAHTSNRIDVELGSELFYHLFRLPLEYFERRPAGVTISRARETETVRNFLTGQGLTSLIDTLFLFVSIGVLFFYSLKLTVIVLVSIPAYVGVAALIQPIMRERIRQKFSRWSFSQQLMVESIVGVQTSRLPRKLIIHRQWNERLAAYVTPGSRPR